MRVGDIGREMEREGKGGGVEKGGGEGAEGRREERRKGGVGGGGRRKGGGAGEEVHLLYVAILDYWIIYYTKGNQVYCELQHTEVTRQQGS